MYIKCGKCNYCKKVDLNLFVSLIGTMVAGGGYWAWISFLFAGTGFAMPICIAIMAGGVAMLKYSDEIVAWISKRYDCPNCNGNQWTAVDDKVAQSIMANNVRLKNLEKENQKYKNDIKDLYQNLEEKHQELKNYAEQNFLKIDNDKLKKLIDINDKKTEDILEDIEGLELLKERYEKKPEENITKINGLDKKIQEKSLEIDSLISEKEKYNLLQNSVDDDKIERNILENDIDFLLEELEQKDSVIQELIQNKEEWEKLQSDYKKEELKIIEKMKKRFNYIYPNIDISDKSYKRLARISDIKIIKFEKQINNLQDNTVDFRDNIFGTDVKEIGFDKTGRIYLRKDGNKYVIVCVGDKNTQNNDIKYLKAKFKR